MSNEETNKQQETESEIKVEDLPVEESAQSDVKGGLQSQNNLKQLGLA